ncbi:MAG: site-specific integrase [Sulfurimonas sp.]|nr:site-specific integrase [Sulfurimonas sp.]
MKTKDRKLAEIAALPFQFGIFKTFSLLRSGFLTKDQANESINCILMRRERITPALPVLSSHTLTPPSLPTSTPRLMKSEKKVLLSGVVKEFMNDKKHGWGPKTTMENAGSYRLITDILGDLEISLIDRVMVRDLRDKLLKLPANLYKLYPHKTANQVFNMLHDFPSPDFSPMSITTVNKHVSRFSSLMKHCMKEGYNQMNPAAGLKIKQKRRPDEERKTYSTEDLKKIAENLPPKDIKPERYWIPLIGMLSGLRLDEACQLYTEDVKEIDGILCFDVNDDGDKKLKTYSSKRIVPIHPKLINLGFLDHVAKMKHEKHPRLWMNLQWRQEDGYGNAFGKWFQRFNRQHITSDTLKTFHSFRHSFANTLKQVETQEALISELMGHANGNITTGRYGKRYKAEVLSDAVSKVDYEEVF